MKKKDLEHYVIYSQIFDAGFKEVAYEMAIRIQNALEDLRKSKVSKKIR